MVAAGTTLRERITCVLAALEREGDIAIGDIVGSKIFNLLGALGIAALPVPLGAAGAGSVESWRMVVLAAPRACP